MYRSLHFAVFLPFVVAGCSDDVGGNAGEKDAGPRDGAIDTTTPTVVGSTPVNASTGEPTSIAVTATFSEAMAPSTVTSASFSLKQGTAPVAGTVTYLDR